MKTYRERTTEILERATAKRARAKKRTAWVAGVACSLAAVLTLNLVFFVPYTTGGFDLNAYRDSEYFPVIEKLGALVVPNSEPRKTNNFERWFGKDSELLGDEFFPAFPPDTDSPDRVPDSSGSSGETGTPGGSYEEVTDNQVAGVLEGDLFKRSSDTLYYLSVQADGTNAGYNYSLTAYSIAGAESTKIGGYTVAHEDGMYFAGYTASREMYLSEDCSTVTVVSPCYQTKTRTLYTAVIQVDVSDPAAMHTVSTTYVSGLCVSSRMLDGKLLLISNFAVRYNPDFKDESQYLPQVGTLDDMQSLPLDDIVLPDEVSLARYTVLATLDTATSQFVDALALLSYSSNAYVSHDNVYVTHSFTDYEEVTENDVVVAVLPHTMSEICRISYADGELATGAVGTVDGAILNRYSMDESGDYFRVFTTVSGEITRNPYGYYGYSRKGSSASLFLLNVEDMALKACVERFAPERESVRSARFKGDKAYVCTAVQSTDPVFIFDLSDPDNIRRVDTGNIPGYSISLVDFTDDTLLGVGYNEKWELKIELYAETADSVISIDSVEIDAAFSSKYKSYFIDRERGYFGLETATLLPTWDWDCEYLLFRYDGYNLVKIASIPLAGKRIGNRLDEARAFFADGWLYVLDEENFKPVLIED